MRSKEYLRRSEQNIIDSVGTVILTIKPVLPGGSKRTAAFAEKHQKPLLHISTADPEPAIRLLEFVSLHRINTLNVAGSRASGEPQIGAFVTRVLDAAFANL